jgi:putative flippase GtrA
MQEWIFGQSRHPYVQFFRYFFVGASSSIVDLCVYGALLMFFGADWYLLYAFLSYMVGLVWNHTLCLLWVFESKHTRLKEYAMVFFISLGGLLWTQIFLWTGVEFFGGHPFFTRVVVMCIVLAWNFGMRKVFVFQ